MRMKGKEPLLPLMRDDLAAAADPASDLCLPSSSQSLSVMMMMMMMMMRMTP